MELLRKYQDVLLWAAFISLAAPAICRVSILSFFDIGLGMTVVVLTGVTILAFIVAFWRLKKLWIDNNQ